MSDKITEALIKQLKEYLLGKIFERHPNGKVTPCGKCHRITDALIIEPLIDKALLQYNLGRDTYAVDVKLDEFIHQSLRGNIPE